MLNWFTFDTEIYNFIRVKEFEVAEEELKKTAPYFESGSVADSIVNPLAREYKTTIFVFSNPYIDITKRLKTEVENEKSLLE